MRLLLSIGCNRYHRLPQLHGAEQDAERIHELLTGPNGNYDSQRSKLLLSPSVQVLRETLDELVFTGSHIDVFTMFFAGHGGVKAGNYYLCLSDADPERLSTTGLPLVSLFAIINEARPRQANIVMDACESGGAMFDMASFMKPELIGEVNTLSISFLAACAANQYASEENQAGVATTELVKYLTGEKVLQDTRPFLDLVELGRAVSADLNCRNINQTPVTWGLNLYGQGEFTGNPHYSGAKSEFPLSLVSILPNSDTGVRIGKYSEALWSEYQLLVTDPSPRRLVDLLQTVCGDLEDSGNSCVPFIRGVATSMGVRASASRDLLAESEVISCCAVALLPYAHKDEVRLFLRELLLERLSLDMNARRSLRDSIKEHRFALVNPVNMLSELFYLPIRISKTLGWLASSVKIDMLLGVENTNDREDARASMQMIVDNYGGSLVAVSDEQAPYIYLFAKVCQACGWQDLGRTVLRQLFENIVSTCGDVTKPEIEPSEAFEYCLARSVGKPPQNFRILARPSQLLGTLLRLGSDFGLADDWDPKMLSLDHKTATMFLPDDYSDFGAKVIERGRNHTFRIGDIIWTIGDFMEKFEKDFKTAIVENKTILSAEMSAACLLAPNLFPDRIAYFLE
jgi:Caspase domain